MQLSFLPLKLQRAISLLNFDKLTEIRLRNDKPIVVEYDGKYNYLAQNGITRDQLNALVVNDVKNVLDSLLKNDVYNYTEQIKNGFISLNGGIRVGICGEYVFDNENIITIRNISSLNVRIAHDVLGCANLVYEKLFVNNLCNLLVCSKPGFGKTTLLRDLARKLSNNSINVLIFDERREIAFNKCNLGNFCDVVQSGNKLISFERAIRTMKPQVIITDELYGDTDLKAVKYAMDCNVNVVASSHVLNKNILKSFGFDYYLELKGVNKGQIIYDKNFNIIDDNSNI